ncbi:MAG: patatin-like phospholipase family protein [Clostridia bacterium]
MKRAIVLGGGGSRGAYELGAWQALRELNVDYQMVVGTSIGSINAALMAQGDYELSEKLWENITVDQVMTDGINLYEDIEKLFNQDKDLRPFLRRYTQNHGADISPLIALVAKSVDEARVRASGIEMGLVTVRFPALTPVEMMLKDIQGGALIDYLIASASVFPAFPVHKIGEESFIDGGYYDALPIGLALREGADEVVCVDLYTNPTHPALLDRPWITYVRPSQPLGSILLFDRPILDRNRALGYWDTLRAYQKVLGVCYSFDAKSVQAHAQDARRFSLGVGKLENSLNFRNAFTRRAIRAPLTDTLKRRLPATRAATELDDLLAGAEIGADKLGIDPFKRYTVQEMNAALSQKLPLEEARACVDQYFAGAGVKVVTELLISFDRAKLMTCLFVLLRRGMIENALLVILTLFPEELLGAMYLDIMLPESIEERAQVS